MADTPFTLAGVMRRADARRVAVQILLTRFCLNFQGKPCTSCLSKNYPELFALMGGQVPDLRGLFLRGHGSHTSTHYGTVTHKSAELGQVQGDAIREIWGSFPELIAPGWGTSTQGAMYYGSPWASGVHRSEGSDWSKRGANFYASRVTPVDGEIRPVNQAIRYLIRAR